MNFCPQCGNECPANAKFCNRCGSPVTPSAYPTPVRASSPKNIAGMIMGIVGLSLCVVSAIYSVFGIAMSLVTPDFADDMALRMFGVVALIFSIAALPFALVSVSMSNRHLNAGSTHKTASLGKTFGSVSTVISIISIFISILMIAFGG